MDSIDAATELGRRALIISMQLSLPVLAAGLLIGLLVSVLQAVTQIQEQTLSFIPKVFAMAGTLFVLLPWFLSLVTDYMSTTFASLVELGMP